MTFTVNRIVESLEQRSASAFVLTGVLILASLVVPVGLKTVTDWSWVVGLVLISMAVVAVSAGLVGLYPQVKNHTPKLALAGVGAAIVAGVAAVGLITLVGTALGSQLVGDLTVYKPMRVFTLVAFLMSGGFSLGLSLFGAAIWQVGSASRTVGGLLMVGGVALLVPVLSELFGSIFGLNTPPWILFPVIIGVALDTVAIGYQLGTGEISSSPMSE